MSDTTTENSPKPRLDPAWFTAIGAIGLLGVLVERLAPLRLLMLLWLVPLFFRRRGTSQVEDEVKALDLPIPGPAQRIGLKRFMANVFWSSMLANLNPRQLGQMVAQVAGQLSATRRRRANVPTPANNPRSIRYRLPFEGAWMVANGGVSEASSHSWDLVAQRYAYDFYKVDESRQSHRGSGDRVEDYYCYGEPIMAVADGEVVVVRDGVRDAPRVGDGWLDWRGPDFRGNHVTIKHGEGEFSTSAHLIPGSIPVRVGERVTAGQVIGRCGHSGHSSEPHLHFQFQDHASFWRCFGLPRRFSSVVIDGRPTEDAYLERGTIVAPFPVPRPPSPL